MQLTRAEGRLAILVGVLWCIALMVITVNMKQTPMHRDPVPPAVTKMGTAGTITKPPPVIRPTRAAYVPTPTRTTRRAVPTRLRSSQTAEHVPPPTSVPASTPPVDPIPTPTVIDTPTAEGSPSVTSDPTPTDEDGSDVRSEELPPDVSPSER